MSNGGSGANMGFGSEMVGAGGLAAGSPLTSEAEEEVVWSRRAKTKDVDGVELRRRSVQHGGAGGSGSGANRSHSEKDIPLRITFHRRDFPVRPRNRARGVALFPLCCLRCVVIAAQSNASVMSFGTASPPARALARTPAPAGRTPAVHPPAPRPSSTAHRTTLHRCIARHCILTSMLRSRPALVWAGLGGRSSAPRSGLLQCRCCGGCCATAAWRAGLAERVWAQAQAQARLGVLLGVRGKWRLWTTWCLPFTSMPRSGGVRERT